MHILPDDPIVEPTDDYWNSFKPKDNSNQWDININHENRLNET
jgi:hypothetical protein